MRLAANHRLLFALMSLLLNIAALSVAHAQDKILMSYGGFNETVGPMWVGVDKGVFKKYKANWLLGKYRLLAMMHSILLKQMVVIRHEHKRDKHKKVKVVVC